MYAFFVFAMFLATMLLRLFQPTVDARLIDFIQAVFLLGTVAAPFINAGTGGLKGIFYPDPPAPAPTLTIGPFSFKWGLIFSWGVGAAALAYAHVIGVAPNPADYGLGNEWIAAEWVLWSLLSNLTHTILTSSSAPTRAPAITVPSTARTVR